MKSDIRSNISAHVTNTHACSRALLSRPMSTLMRVNTSCRHEYMHIPLYTERRLDMTVVTEVVKNISVANRKISAQTFTNIQGCGYESTACEAKNSGTLPGNNSFWPEIIELFLYHL